ncbi:tRNA-dihydrouridine synthase, partial [candidate division WWE3 bacterium CG08_land_8_20_14_0_20_41_10]
MDDVTDFVFREIVATTAKPDVIFTEFTSTDGLFSRGHDKVIRKLRFSEYQRSIVAQIWGATPENFEKAGKYIAELGFDG